MTLPGGADMARLVPEIPEDFSLSVHVPDPAQEALPGSYLITVRAWGPVRVHYGVHGVRGIWQHRCEISREARDRVWQGAVTCRLLEDGAPGLAVQQEGGRWLAVAAWGQAAWVPLDESGVVRGWPVVEDLESLVIGAVWRHIDKRRALLLDDLRAGVGVGAYR